MVIDSHFHSCSLQEKGINIFKLFNELFSKDFAGGIDIALTFEELKKQQELVKKFPKIYSAVGLGPWTLEDNIDIDSQLKELEIAILKYNCIALGEFGLDYYWDYGTKEKQKTLFIEQLKLAEKLKKPVIIHNRNADDDTLNILLKHSPSLGGILHCFSGTMELAKKAIEKGFFISFSGSVTFKTNNNLRKILSEIPMERILLETDSPYLAPMPIRGTINSPKNMNLIYNVAAKTKEIDIEIFSNQIMKNFLHFVTISETGLNDFC